MERINRDRRGIRGSGLVFSMLMAIMLITIMPADVKAIECGGTVTEGSTVVLDSDIGPCLFVGGLSIEDNATLDCQGHTISGGRFSPGIGIFLDETEGAEIKNCNVIGFNSYGFGLLGSSNNILKNNTARDNLGFILQDSSNNNILTNNRALNNGVGFHLFTSSNNILKNNTARDSGIGFLLEDSSNNILKNNTARENNVGFRIINSSNNILKNNKALDNVEACEQDDSVGNVFKNNSFSSCPEVE